VRIVIRPNMTSINFKQFIACKIYEEASEAR
jgi:hypothetical protein